MRGRAWEFGKLKQWWAQAFFSQQLALGLKLTWAYDSVSVYVELPFVGLGAGYHWEVV